LDVGCRTTLLALQRVFRGMESKYRRWGSTTRRFVGRVDLRSQTPVEMFRIAADADGLTELFFPYPIRLTSIVYLVMELEKQGHALGGLAARTFLVGHGHCASSFGIVRVSTEVGCG
jgi:hypothetical protein